MVPASPPAPDAPAPTTPSPGAVRTFSTTRLVGILFIGAQVIFVLVVRFSSAHLQLLTPVAGLTHYELSAMFGGHAFQPEDIRNRYGVASAGETSLTPLALQSVIAHTEEPVPVERAVFIRLHTRAADGTEEFWLWPQQ